MQLRTSHPDSQLSRRQASRMLKADLATMRAVCDSETAVNEALAALNELAEAETAKKLHATLADLRRIRTLTQSHISEHRQALLARTH